MTAGEDMDIRPQSEFNPEAPEIGFYDLSEEVYRAAPGENWSTMKKIGKTPKKYKHCLDHPPKQTDAMKFGNLFHTVVLEPHLLDERYTPFPDTYPAKWNKLVAACKAWQKKKIDEGYTIVTQKKYDGCITGPGKKWIVPPKTYDAKWSMNAGFCKEWVLGMEAKGLIPFKQKDINYAKAMARELRDLEDAQEILEGADGYEVSCFWVNEKYGLPCKCKLDILNTGQIGDLKKITASGGGAEWQSFCRTARNLEYYGQAAFYRDGVNAVYAHLKIPLPELQSFRWLVVEDEPPYDTAIYEILDTPRSATYQWFEAGRELYQLYLGQIELYRGQDKYPSHNVGPSLKTEKMDLEIPDWLKLGTVR
jgi:hypothetical protein